MIETPDELPMSDPPHVESAGKSSTGSTKLSRLTNSRPTMFAMLFGVTGFLGLPLLWRSRVFTATEKWVWSVVVTVYTCGLLWITGSIVMWSYRNIRDALGW